MGISAVQVDPAIDLGYRVYGLLVCKFGRSKQGAECGRSSRAHKATIRGWSPGAQGLEI